MKILIVSDTHGHLSNYTEVIRKVSPIDMLIHCGDVEGQEESIKKLAACECHIVGGNNDYFSDLPREDEFRIGEHRAFLTHGHGYGISMGCDRIAEEAASRDADLVFCGHTHRPEKTVIDGVRIFNPGSLSYPRQEGRRPSYMIMELDHKDTVFCNVFYL